MLIAESDIALELFPDDDELATLEDLLDFEPGLAMIAHLSCLDVNTLDDRSASIVLELWERQQAWIAERAVTAMARVAGLTPPPDPGSEDPWGRDSIDGGVNLVAATLGMTTNGAPAPMWPGRSPSRSRRAGWRWRPCGREFVSDPPPQLD